MDFNQIIKQHRKDYFLYLIPVFIIMLFIQLFFLGIEIYQEDNFQILNIFSKSLKKFYILSFHIFLLISIYIVTQKLYPIEKDTDLFSKKLKINTLLTISIIHMILISIFFYIRVSELTQEEIYVGRYSLYGTIFLSMFYGFIFTPVFLIYIALTLIEKNLRRRLFIFDSRLFEPGKEKIQVEISISYLLIGFFPNIILLLNFIYETKGKFLEGDRVFILGTFFLFLIGTLVSIYSSTQLIKNPVQELVDAMEKVESGDFKIRIPVSNTNELSMLSSRFNNMLTGLEEKEKIKDEFGKYLSPEVAKEILSSGKNIWDGEEKEITILFTDIEGFTTLSEKLNAKEVTTLLNEYFTDLVEIISKYNGVVNKFIGDSILAIFNAPLDDENHTSNSFQAALEISKLFDSKKYFNLKIKTRVGINTGKVIIGNLGSLKRQEYTVIGDSVNIAQRLESMNKELNTTILISEHTQSKLNFNFQFNLEKEILVKGREQPIKVFGI